MQTLISAFKDRAAARRAMERLVESGIAREDLHLQEASAPTPAPAEPVDPVDREIGERTMASAEREVAVDRDAIEAVGHFFVALFGHDRGEGHATRYKRAVGEGHSLVIVDARNDSEAETAAMILHDMGATDVDDHEEGRTSRAGVHLYERAATPSLRDLVDQRPVREESPMAVRAGQVTREREEKATAAADSAADRDRPR